MTYKTKLLVRLTLITQITYLCYRIFFTLPIQNGGFHLFIGLLLFIAEASSGLQGLFEFYISDKRKKVKKGYLADENYPEVDILITTHNEDPELLYKTLNGCKTLIYPDPSKIHVYLCDDSYRESMKTLAAQFDVGYIGMRKEDNPDKKAGNVNNALRHTSSPLVVCLDCDMIPKSNFLYDVVPYFYETENNTPEESALYCQELIENQYKYRIGYVQTPQDFYTLDLFQYNLYAENVLPNEQDYFFKNVNEARARYNASIYCGSNAIISREALLSTGGLSTDSITEDFSSSIKLQKAGYEGRAISQSYIYGLCPFTIEDLQLQRIRWGRGFLQGMRSNKVFRSKLPFMAKISYLNLYNYWLYPLRRLIFMVVPIMSVLFNIHVISADMSTYLWVWFISYTLYNWTLSRVSRGTINKQYSNIIETVLTPLTIVEFTKELIGIREDHFVVTPKDMSRMNEKPEGKYSVVTAVFLILSFICLGMNVVNVYHIPLASQLLVSFWLIQNIILQIYTLSFLKTRQGMDKEFTKWDLKLNVEITTSHGAITTETIHLNEKYIYIQAKDLEHGTLADLRINDDKYAATLNVKIIDEDCSGTLLSVEESTELMNTEYNQYLNILHDRDTTYSFASAEYRFWFLNIITVLKGILNLG